jgi:hypothetical protein
VVVEARHGGVLDLLREPTWAIRREKAKREVLREVSNTNQAEVTTPKVMRRRKRNLPRKLPESVGERKKMPGSNGKNGIN